MAQSPQFDSLELQNLSLPYDKGQRPLEDTPRITAGANTLCTIGGRLMKRWGTAPLVSSNPSVSTIVQGRIARLWSLPDFLVASVENNGVYSLKWFRLAGTEGWQDVQAPTGSDINQSVRPHVGVVSGKRIYLKGFPGSSSQDKYCQISAQMNPSGQLETDYWGLPSPTVPARISGKTTTLAASCDPQQTTITVTSSTGFPNPPFVVAIGFEELRVTNISGNTWIVQRGYNNTEPDEHASGTPVVWRDFPASTTQVTTTIGWSYAYAWKSRTGHVSNRSEPETDLSQNPSSTGAFSGLIPKIKVRGHPDTTRVPKIVIYRTTDGGGVYYQLAEIPNPGDGDVTYLDDDFYGGPVPDSVLDTRSIAPGLTSNSPPPTVAFPGLIGEDTPDPNITEPVLYANRIWFGIGSYLYYSALEENTSGSPEESFPSGPSGNYFKIRGNILALAATTETIYVFTEDEVYAVSGTTRETFSVRPLLANVGVSRIWRRAVEPFESNVAFLSSSHQLVLMSQDTMRVVSYPLVGDLDSLPASKYDVDITFHTFRENRMIVVFFHSLDPAYPSLQYAYDIGLSTQSRRDFWHTPWDVPTCAATRGVTQLTPHATTIMAVSSSNRAWSSLALFTPHSGQDVIPENDGSGLRARYFPCWFECGPFRNPYGNHLHTLRVPHHTSILHAITLAWRKMAEFSETNYKLQATHASPGISYVLDEIEEVTEYPWIYGVVPAPVAWGRSRTWTDLDTVVPYHQKSPKETYEEVTGWPDQMAQSVSIRVSVPGDGPYRFELVRLVITWLPAYGF